MGSPPKTFVELLDRYAKGERDFTHAELDEDPDYNLEGVVLDGVDLSHSYIVAIFRNASFRGAKLTQANLKTCDFSGADLRGANFSDSALCSATFDGANMEGANFAGASIHGYHFKKGEFPVWD